MFKKTLIIFSLFLISIKVSLAAYPERAITMIIPFPPGQATDTFARGLAEELAKNLGVAIIADNRPGAGSNIGMRQAAKAKPDGYTLVIGGSAAAVNQTLYNDPGYDLKQDLTPVSGVFTVPLIFLAHPDSGIQSIEQLIKQATAKPETLAYASAGIGGTQHLSAEMFQSNSKTQLRHIPYKGSGPAQSDFLANRVPLMVDSVTAALPYIKDKKVLPLAVTTKERIDSLPNVPALSETIEDFESVGWAVIFAPKNTPQEIQDKLNTEIVKILKSDSFQQFIADRGAMPLIQSLDEAKQFIKEEEKKWGKAVKTSGALVE